MRPSPAPPMSRQLSESFTTDDRELRATSTPAFPQDSLRKVNPPTPSSSLAVSLPPPPDDITTSPNNSNPSIAPTSPCPFPAASIPTRTVSHAGNIYAYSIFQLSDDLSLRTKQLDALSALEMIFSYERLIKHEFEWDTKYEEWLPRFARFWSPPGNKKLTIEDVWRENKFGIEGHFSVQELNARWDARWRRNLKPIKTEYSRRNKVILLLEKLCAKPNWNTEIAFRFLHEKFPAQAISARTLADFLIPQEKVMNNILEAASSYP